jgi:disulfide bond formation protein DsbB
MNLIIKLLSDNQLVSIGIILISVLALAGALTAEHVFGLKPCILCIYQRIPYVITIFTGLTAFVLYKKKKVSASSIMILISSILFLIEGIIAFYHVGVEQHWWKSIFERCTSSFAGSVEEILAQIQASSAVPCDEIPWSMFGISMAGYNTLMASGLTVACVISFMLIRRKGHNK